MSPTKWCLCVAAILLINNILLLRWVEYTYNRSNEATALSKSLVVNPSPVAQAKLGKPSLAKEPTNIDVDSKAEKPSQDWSSDEYFLTSFNRLSQDSEFLELFWELQLNAEKKYFEIEEDMADLTTMELLEIVATSQSSIEVQFAFGRLRQSDFAGLSDYDLKKLYQSERMGRWENATVLQKLVSKGDVEAISWMKQLLNDGDYKIRYMDSETMTTLYQKAPEFVSEYLQNIDVATPSKVPSLNGLFEQNPELAKGFYAKNFDAIIDSSGHKRYQIGAYDLSFDMSNDQQAKLISALTSDSRHKKNFALRLVNNVSDIQSLRDAYGSLKTERDRVTFIYRISRDAKNQAHRALAKELAANADSSNIKRLINY